MFSGHNISYYDGKCISKRCLRDPPWSPGNSFFTNLLHRTTLNAIIDMKESSYEIMCLTKDDPGYLAFLKLSEFLKFRQILTELCRF